MKLGFCREIARLSGALIKNNCGKLEKATIIGAFLSLENLLNWENGKRKR